VIQIISGIFLAMHYTLHISLAFNSVEYTMRDVKKGLLIRYIHANSASMFFITIYAHICRGFYYGSYMKTQRSIMVFWSCSAFLNNGYSFYWLCFTLGQMSFWGATVSTSMGYCHSSRWKMSGSMGIRGYIVGNPPLNRFYSIHFVLPFLLSWRIFDSFSVIT